MLAMDDDKQVRGPQAGAHVPLGDAAERLAHAEPGLERRLALLLFRWRRVKLRL
jgi:hypothetical protein